MKHKALKTATQRLQALHLYLISRRLADRTTLETGGELSTSDLHLAAQKLQVTLIHKNKLLPQKDTVTLETHLRKLSFSENPTLTELSDCSSFIAELFLKIDTDQLRQDELTQLLQYVAETQDALSKNQTNSQLIIAHAFALSELAAEYSCLDHFQEATTYYMQAITVLSEQKEQMATLIKLIVLDLSRMQLLQNNYPAARLTLEYGLRVQGGEYPVPDFDNTIADYETCTSSYQQATFHLHKALLETCVAEACQSTGSRFKQNTLLNKALQHTRYLVRLLPIFGETILQGFFILKELSQLQTLCQEGNELNLLHHTNKQIFAIIAKTRSNPLNANITPTEFNYFADLALKTHQLCIQHASDTNEALHHLARANEIFLELSKRVFAGRNRYLVPKWEIGAISIRQCNFTNKALALIGENCPLAELLSAMKLFCNYAKDCAPIDQQCVIGYIRDAVEKICAKPNCNSTKLAFCKAINKLIYEYKDPTRIPLHKPLFRLQTKLITSLNGVIEDRTQLAITGILHAQDHLLKSRPTQARAMLRLAQQALECVGIKGIDDIDFLLLNIIHSAPNQHVASTFEEFRATNIGEYEEENDAEILGQTPEHHEKGQLSDI